MRNNSKDIQAASRFEMPISLLTQNSSLPTTYQNGVSYQNAYSIADSEFIPSNSYSGT